MTTIFTAEKAAIAPVNGSSHSGFFPVNSRSRKIRLNTGLMSPIIEEIGNEMADKLAVYKCNVDDEGDLAMKFGIVSIPTLILFKGGQPVHTMVGGRPKAALVEEIEANL